MLTDIIIKGAKENNLKNLDVVIPREKFVVLTGLSGSGKSSLAFDTIFAEGQRRYIESLSSYARQFLGQMDKPNVESIDGLSPSISIDQKTTSNNPRSTVGTVTEIYDYMRLLFARIGIPHCPICGTEIVAITVDQIVQKILSFDKNSKLLIEAPIVRGRKGEYKKELENLHKNGFARVRIDGKIYQLDEEINLDKNLKHDINVVVDRLVIKEGIERRLSDSIEIALNLAKGLVVADVNGQSYIYSSKLACPIHSDIIIPELSPRLFSFNSPYGACPDCLGIGTKMQVSEKKLVVDENLSLRQGALRASGWYLMDVEGNLNYIYKQLAEKYKFSLDVPWKDLEKKYKDLILYGSDDKLKVYWGQSTVTQINEGIIPKMQRRYNATQSEGVKRDIERYMIETPCLTCHGQRLKKEVLHVLIDGKNIAQLTEMPIVSLQRFFEHINLFDSQALIAKPILKEIKERLNFLIDVGLGYLTLARSSGTLSGGESQRIRLATQIGSGLMGVLYILDEPSIGLHQRDNSKLLATLKKLRDLGNTLIVVEHDEETIRQADHIVDIGPGAGENGGYLVAQGSIEDIMNEPKSITGDFLAGRRKINVPKERRKQDGRFLSVVGARQNNLKNINVDFPIGLITAVTGISGSGKSSLVNGIIYPSLASKLNKANTVEGKYSNITGAEYLDKVINIDQSPIGRTPRSNPATYTDLFTLIRNLFAQTPDAKARGYKPGRFSFNVKGGRCEHCMGDGIIKIEMHFLPDVYIPCEVCKGKRYNNETLEVKFKGKSIFDVLDMTVSQALEFFKNMPAIKRKLQTLNDVGLGYIKLGQPSTTLSGGEAQRVKLATELSKRSTGRTLYILDEPTTGLHMADVEKLIHILNQLADKGNTIIVIEHNLDVIKVADHIIDLGPEGGDEGGYLVASGSPEEVAKNENSATGEYLRKVF
ncbi:MAG TPA: excinuclease ABC subunit UvrA [Clostridiales bacterium]|nr:excinuclease ABC subunit UvrA [Clostridiales bacterium]